MKKNLLPLTANNKRSTKKKDYCKLLKKRRIKSSAYTVGMNLIEKVKVKTLTNIKRILQLLYYKRYITTALIQVTALLIAKAKEIAKTDMVQEFYTHKQH